MAEAKWGSQSPQGLIISPLVIYLLLTTDNGISPKGYVYYFQVETSLKTISNHERQN